MKTYSYQQGSIEERVIQVAHYIIEHNATVRQAAWSFWCQQKYGAQRFDRPATAHQSIPGSPGKKNPGCEQAGKTHRGGMAPGINICTSIWCKKIKESHKISQILCDSFCIGIYYEMIDNLTKEGGDVGCLLRIPETKM